MASVSGKIFEIFRYLKSDAVPKAPRPTDAEPTPAAQPRGPTAQPEANSSNEETKDESDHEEIIINEDDFIKDEFHGEEKPKSKFPFRSKKDKDDPKKPDKGDNKGSYSSVNTQATGAVFNIVNSTGVQVGSNQVYYMSAATGAHKTEKTTPNDHIEKDNLITLLMEAKEEPTHKYKHFIANNLGSNWKAFFITLGYLKGRIETLVEEHSITEARYRLLTDWADNDKDGTLGRLTTVLWEEGERQIVRELSLIYKENKK